MKLVIDVEQEDDGRWIAEVAELPGVLTYSATREEAVVKAQALAHAVLVDRMEHREQIPVAACKG